MKPFKSLLLLHFFLSLSLSLSLSSSSVDDTRRLLSFKNSLPDPDQLPTWRLTASPCTFEGVTCKGSTVSTIDLSNRYLSADFSKVSTFLLPLVNLESLVLKNANISGSFSNNFSCSVFLENLDLSENAISGPMSDVSNLEACPGLKRLDISMNSFGPFVKEVGLKSLNVLDASCNKISGEGVVSWILSNGFVQLQNLSLKSNKLAGDLGDLNLKNLLHLDLSSNNFSAKFPLFNDCSSLQHLDLSSNQFFGEVEKSLSTCKNLSFLNLTSNHLSGPFPPLDLQYLYLERNHFEGVFPVDSCKTLVELDISVNNFTGTLPESLSGCSKLELLDVSHNDFSGELPVNTLLQLTSLKSLIMSFNNFAGGLPDSFSKMKTLEILDVASNNLSGSIPPALCPMPRLKVLSLQNNKFDGTIPSSLSNCTKLESLDLSLNYLSGTIPSSLGSLSNLKDLIMWLNLLRGEIPQEFIFLQSLENLILDFNNLMGSIPSAISNCTNLTWISLSNNNLSGEIPPSLGRLSKLAILKLGNNSFSGRIPGELGDCLSLIWLDLNTNFLSGSIPPSLFKQSGKIGVALLTGKRFVYIKNNGSNQCHGAGNLLEFGGIRDEEIERISTCNGRVWRGITQPNFNHNGSMIFLDLSYNMLDGCIPKELGMMFYLFVLNMGHNSLSGPIPSELSGLQNVAILDLSYNMLNGTIPQSLTSLRLGDIDLSNNNLSGMIPESAPLDTFPSYRFENNSGLCGYPLPRCGEMTSLSMGKRPRKVPSLVESMVVGVLLSFLCVFCLVFIFVEKRRRQRRKEAVLEAYIESNSNSGTAWKISARDALSINIATFDQRPLKKLTFADLLEATNGFHADSLIGSGGFGDVYRAELKDGSVVAVKKLIHVSGQGDREFTAEMETIGKIKHRNLVPLLGYCRVGEERLLVYEYMKYGSLEDVLQDKKKIGVKLDWGARRRIAVGAARGLAFLHHSCIPNIIHRDMKSSNVLVDEKLEARVSDFGMARMMNAMDTHLSVSTLAGTPGYVPPEYYQSFRVSKKGDVYSFGVVLLELLTGRKPTDSSDFGDNNLVGWVMSHSRMKIGDVFDPRLIREDPNLVVELVQHLKIACACLEDRPSKRPSMIQVMAMFKEIQAGYGIDCGSSFDGVEGIEMSIKEGNEVSSNHF